MRRAAPKISTDQQVLLDWMRSRPGSTVDDMRAVSAVEDGPEDDWQYVVAALVSDGLVSVGVDPAGGNVVYVVV